MKVIYILFSVLSVSLILTAPLSSKIVYSKYKMGYENDETCERQPLLGGRVKFKKRNSFEKLV